MTEGDGTGGDDPFEHLQLDENFVRRAWKLEPSADERVNRAAEARAAYDQLAHQRKQHRRARRPLRRFFRRVRSYLPALLVIAVVGAASWQQMRPPAGRQAAPWESAPARTWSFGGERPTPSPATGDQPLGRPTVPASAGGPHLFIATHPGTSEPVAYDPCRVIAVVVNHRTAPGEADEILVEALAEVSANSGLQFAVEGASDEAPVDQRPAFQRDRYGDRWAPVLVAWSDPGERVELDGNVAGIGGSLRTQASPGSAEVYVSGGVTLDGPQLAEILERRNGRAQARSVIMHELGHLVGLDHVDDPDQLMNGNGNPGVTRFEAGDVAGLNRLGAGRCFERL